MKEIIFPKSLKKGSKIALISPAGSVDPSQLEKGINLIISKGYEPVLGKYLYTKFSHGYNYAGTEKVSDLPKKLSKDGAPSGSKPSAGSFAYYSPWGNLAVFYKDFQYSNGLIILGETEAGLENLKDIDGEVKVEILQ